MANCSHPQTFRGKNNELFCSLCLHNITLGISIESAEQQIKKDTPDWDKRLKDLDELVTIQRREAEASPNDSYMRGMANGMILAQATMNGNTNTDLDFVKKPERKVA